MYNKYKDRAGFLFVYIHEAHPDGGWQMESNTKANVVFKRAKNWSQRESVAGKCCEKLKLSMPVVVDGVENTVDELYAAWPERIFVVDGDMKVVYAGKQGPWGFKPKQAEKVLKKLLR